ncbi:MAG: hypothetical protein GY820_48315 [Gammaproteobacteria bacterium]|nr:hypothetical protein [Gammaproteobacteria bacterium]
MNTTLNKIREYSPCEPSWEKLLASLNKTKADDEPVSFKYILTTLDIEDAVWCLRTLTYKEQCLFMADVAELTLPIFEKYSDDPAPRKCIQAIRDYEQGLIGKAELQAAANAAYAANADAAAADAIDVADAACATAYAADPDADAAGVTACAAEADVNDDKWQEIEALFIKYFVDERQ